MLVKNDLQPLRFTNQFLEMRVLISGFNALIKQVKEQNSKLEKISKIDGLTQIYNRRAFDEIIAAQWKQAQQQQNAFGVILLDVDHFKNYNDFKKLHIPTVSQICSFRKVAALGFSRLIFT